MITKGIRGAITLSQNSPEAIREATLELLEKMLKENSITSSNISHVIFTTTEDINAAFPAKFARTEIDGFEDIAMMCFHELNVKNSLRMCLRILIVVNCEERFKPKFVYLKDAANLRK